MSTRAASPPVRADGVGRWRGWPRRQPPAFSPLSLGAIRRAGRTLLSRTGDTRPSLLEYLRVTYGAAQARGFDSGTAALSWALRRHVPAGAVVAMPAYSCYDVASAAVGADVRVTLYDLDPATLGPDADSLDQAVREAAALVVAPLYGIPLDWDLVLEVAGRHGVPVVEDAAQGHGARWRGHPVGSFGTTSVLSFGRGKGWTGGGGGAALLRGDDGPSAGERIRGSGVNTELGAVVRATGQHLFSRPTVFDLAARIPWLAIGETLYRAPRPPRPMSRVSARILSDTRAAAEAEAAARRASGEIFRNMLPYGDRVRPITPPDGATPGYLRFPVRLRDGMAGFPDPGTAKRLGIAAGYPSTLGDLPAVRGRLATHLDHCPGARDLVRELVTLATHSLQSSEERDRVVELISRYGACCTPT